MRPVIRLLLLVMACAAAATGCGQTNGGVADSAALGSVASQFKAKAVTNRYAEAEKLIHLLPSCPVLSQRSNGISLLINYDYSRPSYKLSRAGLVGVLGQPETSTDSELSYRVAQDAHLLVLISHGNVVKSYTYGSPM